MRKLDIYLSYFMDAYVNVDYTGFYSKFVVK